ncbi:NADPH-dependent FMN reductase [Aquipseudomonas ullengensis]|uniref:NAD(P)H-dependent oxidoreductase n=1 Tax=Aquipseudomonas ullengensis TaxID=2759166 RepID=A0A7W4LND3_9GAMM|nr:NAD(P)H-dependent oxidoreductase [Pseudomonas ullengensis]MBB2496345.1 NAD(P)H-dependent oxidoreductase [Pseudomonas ullengensis]
MLNIVLVAGSSRRDSQSAKVANFLRQRLIELDLGSASSTSVIDLGAQPLALWPSDEQGPWSDYQQRLQAADAVVVIAPEWNGMAAPAIKNFFLYASKFELAHKPALLVGVSSGIGGAYPISELRASGYKNCRLGYLPEHLIVRNVTAVLNDGPAANEDDQRIRARVDYALDILGKYGVALKPVRESIDLNVAAFANGM